MWIDHSGFIEIMTPFKGPVGNPRIERAEWTGIVISYWVIYQNKNGEIEEIKKILVLDEISSESVRAYYNACQTRDWTLGQQYPSKMMTSRGEWYFAFATPKNFLISRISDTDYGYRVVFNDTDFYETLKSLCMDHEKLSEQHISRQNTSTMPV